MKKPIESIENLTLPEGGQPPEMPCGTGIKKEGMTAGVQGICGKILTAGAAMLIADVTAAVADLGPDLDRAAVKEWANEGLTPLFPRLMIIGVNSSKLRR